MLDIHNREQLICELISGFLKNKGNKLSDICKDTNITSDKALEIVDILQQGSLVSGLRIVRDASKKPVMVFCENATVTIEGMEYIKIHQKVNCEKVHNNIQEKLPTVFLSYQWDDSEYADKISEKIENIADFHTDKKCIGAWESIEDFMKSIKKHDYVILLISEKYLQSFNCMYEALQLSVCNLWSDKVMCVLMDNADIYTLEGRIKYAKYWTDKYNSSNKELADMPDEVKTGFTEDLRKMKEIELRVGDILKHIADSNNPPKDKAIEDIYSRISENRSNLLTESSQPLTEISYMNTAADKVKMKYEILMGVKKWLSDLYGYADKCSLQLDNALVKNDPRVRLSEYNKFSNILSEMAGFYNEGIDEKKALLDSVNCSLNLGNDFADEIKKYITEMRNIGEKYLHQPDTSDSLEENNYTTQSAFNTIKKAKIEIADEIKKLYQGGDNTCI